MFLLVLYSGLKTYFSYPIKTGVSIVSNTGMAFPDVTVCNNNQVKGVFIVPSSTAAVSFHSKYYTY